MLAGLEKTKFESHKKELQTDQGLEVYREGIQNTQEI